MKLVIVESPTKAKTISRYLGEDYRVESSYGHVRDLPKSELGIDVSKNFEPRYIIPLKARTRVTALKKLAAKCDTVILATDEDREGEAIAWHLIQALGLNHESHILERKPADKEARDPKSRIQNPEQKVERIAFHEITESAIQGALRTPRPLDNHLVDAQQARRILDRLVGYNLSPFLWKKIMRGLSAGRVQSVALRLIVDREEEIGRFVPQEYWTVHALVASTHGEFETTLMKIDGEPVAKPGIAEREVAESAVQGLKRGTLSVLRVERKETKKNPLPPFTTSTLQQEASKRLGLSAKKTMFLAQRLYENGHITYMRTDSVNLSDEALSKAAGWIKKHMDPPYSASVPRKFKNSSKNAQEAHEAIRPTDPGKEARILKVEKAEARLYDLIWRRFMASQLPPATLDATAIDIEAADPKTKKKYLLRASGNTLRFDGFLALWPLKFEAHQLPPVEEGGVIDLRDANAEQHFTEPPPRYNEASLIKTLEQYDIGRPSTYAPTISVIQERNYVEKREGRFFPTEIGTLVNKVLTENFPEIVDIQFTAKMEEGLDLVAAGETQWRGLIREFYDPFETHLKEKYETVSKESLVPETTNVLCEKCGKPMIIKFGRFGKFMACSGFPDCKSTKTMKEPPKSSGVRCPKCLASEDRKETPGELLERRVSRGRARGKLFWGCGRYPACDYAVWEDPTKAPPPWPLPEKAPSRKGRKAASKEPEKEET